MISHFFHFLFLKKWKKVMIRGFDVKIDEKTITTLITGHSKKSVSWADHLFFVNLYCCFTQKWCINNGWKGDFWHPRCLFYQVESILFHIQQPQKIFFQEFPWKTAKTVKNLRFPKMLLLYYLRHAEHGAKNRTSLCRLDHDTLFFE